MVIGLESMVIGLSQNKTKTCLETPLPPGKHRKKGEINQLVRLRMMEREKRLLSQHHAHSGHTPTEGLSFLGSRCLLQVSQFTSSSRLLIALFLRHAVPLPLYSAGVKDSLSWAEDVAWR